MKHLSKGSSVLIIFLAGCSTAQVPYTQNHPSSYQKVARATSHWDILADDVATQTVAKIGTQKTIYIAEPIEGTDFNRAFHNFLITQMVNKGIPVSDKRTGSVEVSYDAQVITHNSERRAYQPGTLTMLAAGLMVAYNVPNWKHSSDKAAAFLGATAGVDAVISTDSGSPTKSELVVTTSAIEDGHYLMRKTDIYYIETKDLPLFMHMEKPGTPVKEFSVVGAR